MSGRVNDARLPLDDRRLKRATRELVKVVGGAPKLERKRYCPRERKHTHHKLKRK